MSGRTAREAIQNFVGPLQQAVSCVTDAILVVRGRDGSPEHALELMLNNGVPVRLAGDGNLAIHASQSFRTIEGPSAVGPWGIALIGYVYALMDSEQREIL